MSAISYLNVAAKAVEADLTTRPSLSALRPEGSDSIQAMNKALTEAIDAFEKAKKPSGGKPMIVMGKPYEDLRTELSALAQSHLSKHPTIELTMKKANAAYKVVQGACKELSSLETPSRGAEKIARDKERDYLIRLGVISLDAPKTKDSGDEAAGSQITTRPNQAKLTGEGAIASAEGKLAEVIKGLKEVEAILAVLNTKVTNTYNTSQALLNTAFFRLEQAQENRGLITKVWDYRIDRSLRYYQAARSKLIGELSSVVFQAKETPAPANSSSPIPDLFDEPLEPEATLVAQYHASSQRSPEVAAAPQTIEEAAQHSGAVAIDANNL